MYNFLSLVPIKSVIVTRDGNVRHWLGISGISRLGDSENAAGQIILGSLTLTLKNVVTFVYFQGH